MNPPLFTFPESTADERAEAGFTAAILANPGDDTPRLVYADWLDERGHHHRAKYLRQIRRCKFVRRVGRESGWALFPRPEMPRPVRDVYQFWQEQPPARSPRCLAWLTQIARGWRPPAYVRRKAYATQCHWFGVFLWEYLHVIDPLLSGLGS